MIRLIERGLMFGNLFAVDSPILVERYNRALEHLTGKRTGLTDFHIDISGFSPEVGHELGDDLYLNHAGVNRQFILLSTEQKTAPLLNAKFSTSRSVLKHWIEDNEAELFALTARDAVAGELVNSVFRLDSPARLFDVRKVRVEADTTEGTVETAEELRALITRFHREPDGWHDDVLIARMIDLARKTGDITRQPVTLKHSEFDQSNFWTAHFGGLYIFRGVDSPFAVSRQPKDALGDLPIDTLLDFKDRNGIARALNDNGLVEPILSARGIDGATILRQKMDFIIAAVATHMGKVSAGATRRQLRAFARAHAESLPAEYQALAALHAWAVEDGPWPEIASDHPAYFYTLRAVDHADADLVNMLLAELSPLDIRQLFICHKEAFYSAYQTWPDEKRDYVADFLAREYAVDKAGTREALFGHEPEMTASPDAPATPPPLPGADLIRRVGPWGAVRR